MSESLFSPSNAHVNELLFAVGVGTWDWELATGRVVYSDAWAKILGYTAEELPQVVGTWERMVLPEDLADANAQIERHLAKEKPIYEAEFRMVCKDGTIIWAQDKGCVTEYDAYGEAIRFVGVLQNVTRLKDTELRLMENQETLDLAVSVAELGTWDWDIPGNCIRYNDEYLKMLNYSQSDMDGSIEEWEEMNHPEDLIHSGAMLAAYMSGKTDSYECIIRMKHRDGHYIWTKDVGKIVERDARGAPVRLIGGHLNIDTMKHAQEQLTEALEALEYNNLYLEREVESRTGELVEQEKLLWTVNQISRKLLTFQATDHFEDLVRDCLRLLGESIDQNRIYIWKDRADEAGQIYCTQIYEWVRAAEPIQDDKQFEEIPYADLPAFAHAIASDKCLNSLIRNLSASEQAILETQGIKTILIAPVRVGGKGWGFIGVDNCESEQLFTSMEENMLLMSGSMLANTIEKMDTAAKLHEMEERTQLMLDAMPLCCNLWTADYRNMNCNEEAVRLFGMSSQDEYLEKFFELSPEFQPCGGRSRELVLHYLALAFAEGSCRFDWMHQKLDGTPIPAEVTLVRIKHKGSFIVASYTRDLRELKAMLAELQSKEDDLRTARDEALLGTKAKSNFLANMSHEIRTPMNAISGLSEIILRESTSEITTGYAKGIQSACSNLLGIINDILDISKIESGKLEIYHAQYELDSLLNDVITISRMRLGSKPLMFVTYIDSELPAQIFGDEIRIKQILINLLSNAIKFTHEGHISLRVSGGREGDCAILRFSVQDSGMGIREEDLQRLFAEFERVNTTKNRNIEGTGLGLAIAKQLCEMMGGTIAVESTYGVGSTFTAIIPQKCPSYEPLSQVQTGKCVLLYEPRELYRNSVSETLENLGCHYVSCSNQSELHDNLLQMPYDYLLAPALYLEKLQTLLRKKNLPLPLAVFADQNEVLPDSSVDTIMFPVNCLQLANLLNGHLEDGRSVRHCVASSQFVAPTARVLVVDDNAVNLHVAEGLMAPYQFKIDTAKNGRDAITMIKRNPYDLVFMDHMMPEMDGIDATVAIRQMEGAYYKTLPIVALTANALVGTREMFIREGMNDFLAKPIEIKKLANVLRRWLPESKLVERIEQAPAAETKLTGFQIDGVNTVQGISLVGGNEVHYLQILASFFTDGTQKCSSLLRHLHKKDLLAFGTEVHALKSTCATIGALEVSAMAAKMEAAAQVSDAVFIDENADAFLTALEALLEAIKPLLPRSLTTPEPSEQGDMTQLKGLLDALYEAAEFANIAQVEAVLMKLREVTWPREVLEGLSEIQECIAVFDYDGVLACILRLGQG